MDSALKNLQWLICYKTKSNKLFFFFVSISMGVYADIIETCINRITTIHRDIFSSLREYYRNLITNEYIPLSLLSFLMKLFGNFLRL